MAFVVAETYSRGAIVCTNAYEQTLMERAVSGDTVATTVLLSYVHTRLRSHIARRIPGDLRRTVDADDVLQEAQIEAYRHVDRFEPRGPDSFYRWVATIAIRRLRNAIRHNRAAKRGGGQVGQLDAAVVPDASTVALLDLIASDTETPSRTAAHHEAIQAMQTALSSLPEDYRRAVQLVYIDGRSVTDAAALMGRTDRAIHNLCYKAKDYLRGLLGSGSRFLSGS